MEVLDSLYKLAEQTLIQQEPDWTSFAQKSAQILDANVLIYHLSNLQNPTSFKATKNNNWDGRVSVISTNAPQTVDDFLSQNFGEELPISEDTMAPLEPIRRTDLFSNEQFAQLGNFSRFMIERGIFYDLITPAIMSDGSLIRFYLWRDQDHKDFSELEKQRSALFMRYLLVILDPAKIAPEGPDPAIVAFGQKYNLTATEIEILQSLLQGNTPKAIAGQSGRTYGTVRWHIQNILEKCQVNSQQKLLHEFYALIKG